MKAIVLWSINLLLALLCILRKRKIKVVPVLCLVFFIVLFSLLTPGGKILFSVGRLNVTQGAIEDGLLKSGILVMLQFLSKFFISAKIKFPGRLGSFITEVFFIYERLSSENFIANAKSALNETQTKSLEQKADFKNQKKRLSAVMEAIDLRLIEIWNEID
ncbi:MAG: hypothetical protein ACI4LX_09995 [Treponema sp.]